MNRVRLNGLDIARGLALLGIIANHIFYTAQPVIARSLQDYHAVLFMLLAGIMATYAASDHATLKSVVRGVICIVLGLAIGAGNPEVDLILLNYGILFLTLGILVPKLSIKKLLWSGTLVLLLNPIAGYFIREKFGTPHGPNISVFTIIENPLLVIYDPIMASHYPLFQWSAIFLFGAAIGKMNLSAIINDRKRNLVLAFSAVSIFVIAKSISIVLDKIINNESWSKSLSDNFGLLTGQIETRFSDLVLSAGYAGTSLSIISALAVSIFVISVCNLWVLHFAGNHFLATLGKATISLYSIHVVVHMLLNGVMNSFAYYGITVVYLVLIVKIWKMSQTSAGPIEAITGFIYQTELDKRLKTKTADDIKIK